MAFFTYRGRSGSGELVEGTLEGADAGEAAALLMASGITPVSIDAAAGGAAAGGGRSLGEAITAFFQPKVSDEELMLFSRQLYALLKSGVPIMQGLAGLQQSATSPTFGAVLKRVRASLDSGHEFSAALARESPVFSEFFVNMVRVGETSGRLEEVLLRMYEHIEFSLFMRNQVKSATRYPIFVIGAMVIAIVVINLLVIPAFANVFKSFNAPLPLMTQLLIGFSDFMVAYWWLMAGAAVAAGFMWHSWLSTPRGRLAWDEWKMRIPVAGKIINKATLARFARSFALASRSGVPIIQGLSLVARTVENAFIAERVEKMRIGVERGESVLRTAIAAKIFTPMVLQMVQVGEESGQLDAMMEDVAQMYQREVEYELKTLSAQIEPILIVFLGALVLVLALGIFLPMWDLGKVMIKR
jgi:MSHA biogenesis protein MshG